jgi:hypothetical protein
MVQRQIMLPFSADFALKSTLPDALALHYFANSVVRTGSEDGEDRGLMKQDARASFSEVVFSMILGRWSELVTI